MIAIPNNRSSRPLVLLSTLLTFVLFAASCGGAADEATGSDTEIAVQTEEETEVQTEDLAFAETDESDDELTSQAATDTSQGDAQDSDSSESAEDTGGQESEDASDSSQGSPPTTAGSGLGPVNTIVSDPGGDPDNIYIGQLGNLRPNEALVQRAIAPPESSSSVLPLTGETATVPNRPAAVVKIDNGSAALPHQGLNAADIVIEEEVEGGVTRFAAVFHSTSTIVGPVRSGRTTDIGLVGGLGTPLLMYSGANRITEGLLRNFSDIQNRSFESAPSGYWRENGRSAPSNLFSDTAPHWASATGGPPPTQFHFRGADESAEGESVTEFSVSYPASTARWEWDGERWLRWQRGTEHMLVSGEQVDAVNVVVIEAERIATGMVDSSGGAVPEFFFVGTGNATVFTDGKRIDGTWTKPSINSVPTLTLSQGDPIELTPGRTWMQLVETGAGQLN